MKKTTATLLLLMLAIPLITQPPSLVTADPPTPYPYPPDNPVITNALHYLSTQQAPDGSIAGLATSAWAAMAYAAANHTDARLTAYLADTLNLLDENTATDWQRDALALVACGQEPTSIAGTNLLTTLQSFYDGTQMGNPSLIYDDLFGVLALTACGTSPQAPIIQQEQAYILTYQQHNGGWGDADTTAAAIMALAAAGEDPHDTPITAALAYLKTTQADTGGFQSWGTTNAASTAWATCALVAAGHDPTSPYWRKNDNSPIDYLVSLQRTDGGFNWSTNQNLNSEWMTSYVLCALLARPYPVTIWQPPHSDDPVSEVDTEWTGTVRVEGKTATLFNGTIHCSNTTIQAYNQSTGHMQSYTFPDPTVLSALVTALDSAHISYYIIFYPDWDAFYVKTIGNQSDWWHYWVDYALPMIDAGSYFLTENDQQVLFSYLEDWDAHALRMTLDKHTVNVSEEFHVHTFNESMAPAADVTVWVGTTQVTTDESGTAVIQCTTPGDYQVYAECPGYVRSEKTPLTVIKSLQITRPKNNTMYVWNRPLQLHHRGVFILGALDIEVDAVAAIDKVEFYLDGTLYHTDVDRPFTWRLNERAFLKEAKICVYGYTSEYGRPMSLYDSDEITVALLNCFPRLHGNMR